MTIALISAVTAIVTAAITTFGTIRATEERVGDASSLASEVSEDVGRLKESLQAEAFLATAPEGTVIAWSPAEGASTHDIPRGWQICDGDNGTPNLKDRFLYGETDLSKARRTGTEEPTGGRNAKMKKARVDSDDARDWFVHAEHPNGDPL